MISKRLTPISILDGIKLNNGKETLKEYFHNVSLHDTERAANLINDINLHFSTLFLLRSEIKKFDLSNHLSYRNAYTLTLINEILSERSLNSQQLSPSHMETTHSVLKWIIETGYLDDGLNNQYDEILDAAAILLIKKFKNKSYINIIVEMIFNRHKKNSFNYDLIWALFEAQEPQFLFLIANRLSSKEWKDIELSRKLLKFIPGMDFNLTRGNSEQYQYALRWLQDNHLFLHYTGETFQQTSNPKPYVLSLEAKYLCKPVANDKEETFRALSNKEQSLFNKIKDLPIETKMQLSNYSFLIYRQNKDWWKMWIRYPVAEQMSYVKYAGGL